jgi:hypothetical protein
VESPRLIRQKVRNVSRFSPYKIAKPSIDCINYRQSPDHEENNTMPIISMFYGIIIRLYMIDNQHHNLPHIHAKYAEFEASIGIGDGEILAGDLPRKQLRLVQAWIELHRDELMADWELAVSGENPYKIEPL